MIAELLFAMVIALAVLVSLVWLLEGYKKERDTQQDPTPMLGVVLPNKKDKNDE